MLAHFYKGGNLNENWIYRIREYGRDNLPRSY